MLLYENYTPIKKKVEGEKDKGEKDGEGKELEGKKKDSKIMVPGTGDNLSQWFGIAWPIAEKEESRVLKGQGPSQNFVIFQVAKLNLNRKGTHILEMQDRKYEF